MRANTWFEGLSRPRPASLSGIARLLLAPDVAVLALCALYVLALLPVVPLLGTAHNLRNVVSNVWPLLIVALGQTVVLIVAGIDLSQPAVVGLASVVAACLVTSGVNPDLFRESVLWGWFLDAGGGPLGGSALALPAALVAALATGAAVGLVNGLSITRLGMPPFMVTLVTSMLVGASAIWLTKSENVINLPPGWVAVAAQGPGGVSWAALSTVALCLVSHFVLSRTLLGRWFYAVGTNAVAARISGAPVGRVVVFAYMFSGVCAGLGAILYSSRLQVGRPTTGADMLLDVIGATVIGGTSLFGGSGKVLWTVFGVVLFSLLNNSLNLLNLEFNTVYLVKGGVIFLAALVDVARVRLRPGGA